MNRSSRLVVVLIALCLLGGFVSWELLRLHAGGASVLTRVCALLPGDGSGCTRTASNAWSRFTVPVPTPGPGWSIDIRRVRVPVAFAGAASFATLAIWYLLVGGRRRLVSASTVAVRAGVVLGGMASLGLLMIMASDRAPWCGWCVFVHAVNAGVIGLVWTIERRRPRMPMPRPRWRPASWLPPAGYAAVFVGVVFVAAMALQWRATRTLHGDVARLQPYARMVTTLRSDPVQLLAAFEAQPRQRIPLRAGETLGPGQVPLHVFTDFQCPGCRCLSLELDALARHVFADRVKIFVRHFPLCPDCNPGVERDLHPEACVAACAAEAARRQGGDTAFAHMSRLLFDHQSDLGSDGLGRLARELELDVSRFDRDRASLDVRAIIDGDITLARALDVRGTPVMFLDGRRVPEICHVPAFWSAFVAARVETLAANPTVPIEVRPASAEMEIELP